MIFSNDFAWLHLPKTGGTSCARLFRKLKIEGINIDPDSSDDKHHSRSQRILQSPQLSLGIPTYITTRRLLFWLLSDWHHKTVAMGISLPFEPVRSGMFYSLRLGGTWVAADYWPNLFDIKTSAGAIRLEELTDDANRLIHPYLPLNTPPLEFPRENTNQYSRHLGDFFNRRDVDRIYTNNPAWSAWEEQLYGDLLTLRLSEQLRSLKRRL